ncbi:hypothetical protein HYFRA_00009388 [Hymenoscyphus fraxineus]|uniref:S-adenosyl-L-methionine-dependent methyltransferase n=1 Tax=Hymenoscyphus fraxineus TaxID=746836 RepID=A0A9N9PX15_9HELO|nr:hypothetical protein HYFRA_00009388 [Hymenoscyphus fraxineus]
MNQYLYLRGHPTCSSSTPSAALWDRDFMEAPNTKPLGVLSKAVLFLFLYLPEHISARYYVVISAGMLAVACTTLQDDDDRNFPSSEYLTAWNQTLRCIQAYFHYANETSCMIDMGDSKGDKVFLIREEEEPTLDGLHEICRILGPPEGKGLHWAPIQKTRRVLDLGSGTGQWIKEFVQFYDVEKIVGLDLESPRSADLPPNSSFVKGDLESPWPLEEKFDFVHARFLAGCLEKWPQFFQQCYNTLEPGGWFEIVDILITPYSDDNTLSPHSNTVVWNKLLSEISESAGRPMAITSEYANLATAAGFRNVKEVISGVPGKPWGGEGIDRRLGALSEDVHRTVSERLGLDYLVTTAGMDEKEVRGKLEGVLEELGDERIHTKWPFYAVFAQKPLDA